MGTASVHYEFREVIEGELFVPDPNPFEDPVDYRFDSIEHALEVKKEQFPAEPWVLVEVTTRVVQGNTTFPDRPYCDDAPCATCNTQPQHRICHTCGVEGWVTDCGHQAQPRPISADETGMPVCDDCLNTPCGYCGGEGSLACGTCTGCGEGQVDGARCTTCKGRGSVPCECQEMDDGY